ncbi:MAG: photosynthetic complex assembly protein PuhC [Pseudomonadota bacterium]
MSDRPMNLAQARNPELVNRDREMIPSVLLKAMLILALTSLALVTYAVLTDRPLTGVPEAAPIAASRTIVLDGDPKTGAVRVLEPSGAVIADLSESEAGFVSVIWRAMYRTRMQHGVAATLPLSLVSYENGRLAIHDGETGWSVELGSFGKGNRDVFAAYIAD